MSSTHDCAAPGCTVQMPHDKLMCLKHWRMVSPETQREVWATWRRVHRDPEAYRAAREKAIAEVDARDPGAKQGGLFDA